MALTPPSVPSPPPPPPPPAEVVDAVVDAVVEAAPAPPPPPPPPAGDVPNPEEFVSEATADFGVPPVAVDGGVRVGGIEVNAGVDASTSGMGVSGDVRVGHSTLATDVHVGPDGAQTHVSGRYETVVGTSDFDATRHDRLTEDGLRSSGTTEAAIETQHGGASYRAEFTEDDTTAIDGAADSAVDAIDEIVSEAGANTPDFGPPPVAVDVGVRVGDDEVNAGADASTSGVGVSGDARIGDSTLATDVHVGPDGAQTHVSGRYETVVGTSDFDATRHDRLTEDGLRSSGTTEATIETQHGGASHRNEFTEDGETNTTVDVTVSVGDVDEEVSVTHSGNTPDIRLVNDAGATVTREADGTVTIDQHAEVGVDVDGTRVTIGQDGVITGDGSNSSVVGDTGVRVETADGNFATGVTAGQSVSDDGRATSTDAGVFVEHDDDRVEAGVFRDGTNDGELFPENTGSDVGVYASHNDDTVRAGIEDRTNAETFDAPPSSGVFVEDVDGDRTGIGIISATDMRGDVQSFGTGGVYVDIDGERHDAHTTRTVGTTFDDVSESSFTGVREEYDLGPISATGRIGLETDADDDGDGNVDGRIVVDGEIDSEFGSLDELLPDELLDEPTTSSDRPSEQVTVHDELGNPIDHAGGTATSDEAPTPDLNDSNDTSTFGDVADSIGDVAAGAVDAVQDFFEDLVGGGED